MATYAIGDVHGCFQALQRLLRKIVYDPRQDRLWFVGDLVNRGPKSLQVLRFVKNLGDRAVVVLGNHDLHLVSEHEGFDTARKGDTFDDVLGAPDRKELVDWLRTRPMMHVEGNWAMVHARWDCLHVIVNTMTRLRFCTQEGKMDLKAKGTTPPPDYVPWFALRRDKETIVCGHWSALGVRIAPKLAALDSGCVWGGKLTALRLEDRAVFEVPCVGYQAPGGEA